MKTELAIIPTGSNVSVLDESDDLFDADCDHTADEFDADVYIDIIQDVERLEAELHFTEIRVTEMVADLSRDTMDLTTQLSELKRKLIEHQAALAASDDFEEQEEAKELKKAMERKDVASEDEDDDDVSELAYDQEELTPEELQEELLHKTIAAKCKKVYLVIARATHPDKCGNTSRANLFIEAKAAYDSLNLRLLERIYQKVFHKPYGEVNLIERLNAARMRRDILRNQIENYQSLPVWGLIEVADLYSYEVALKSYRATLEKHVASLLELIEQQTKEWS